MKYIEVPNLPEKPVEWVIVDGRINVGIEKKLLELGIKAVKTDEYPGLYAAVSGHPDIMVHHIGGSRIVYAPGTVLPLLEALKSLGFDLVEGNTVLTSEYPGNIAYNVARVGKIAFHNTRYTDPVIRVELEKAGVELVHVNQGYAKCSVSVVGDTSIITADKGIARAAQSKGIDALLIDPEEAILLPGLKNGFIGGSTGLIDSHKWAATGKIENLKSFHLIKAFLVNKGFEIVPLSEAEVIDTGSIIPILTK